MTEEQKEIVKKWFAEGLSLSQVQTRLKSELGIDMTYFDVRMLQIDLKAEIIDKPANEPEPENPAETDGNAAEEESNAAVPVDNDGENDMSGETDDTLSGGVSISVDTIVIPGAAVSGDVTFSDGVTAKWLMDPYGRMGLENVSKEGYQPSPQDVAAFQKLLIAELRKRGMA